MFFSFFVPNTITTINSTISQCQMEKDPMIYSRNGNNARTRLIIGF